MNFKTTKNILLPIIPSDPARGQFDSSVIKMIEEGSYNTKDDLLLIARAYKDLIDLLVTLTLISENDVTDNMNDLRNQK